MVARVALLLFVVGHTPWVLADTARCPEWAAHTVSLQGQATARPADDAAWQPVVPDQKLCPGDSIQTGANSRVALRLPNQTVVRLDQHTFLTLTRTAPRERSLLELLKGALHTLSRVPRSLSVKTPYVNAAIEGTEFTVLISAQHTLVSVLEGVVALSNRHGALTLHSEQSAVADASKAPTLRLDIRPQDSVRWTAHVPRILHDSMPQPVDKAQAQMDVGRLDEADKLLSGHADLAEALALRAMIALAGNDLEQAQRLAQQAVARDDRSVVAHIALSYVRQATNDLSGAERSARTATAVAPDDGLAWTRLGELRLAQGDKSGATRAAEKGAQLAPRSTRALSLLGFVHLTDSATDAALDDFEQAGRLDPTDPLPRLGKGLALIRLGETAAGREQLEIAISLNPGDALTRSYLGKAYDAEQRPALARDQYQLAMRLDPQDPTPWYYLALNAHADHQPIDALHHMDEAIARNDNRAVYRSRLLLDQDLAARNTNQARLYQRLGFQQLGLSRAWQALNQDPANPAAHRFLSDSYAALPRHDIARASELLQSQLLNELNTTPLQPQLSESDLALPGISTSALNEYDRLFVRDGVNVSFSGLGGSRDTLANDLVLSGINGRTSYSFGQFHYESDGFRDNNDLQHNIYNAFFQTALSDRSNVQVEARKRHTHHGDLPMRFDPDSFFPDNRRQREIDTLRVGFSHKFDVDRRLLVSGFYQDEDEQVRQVLTDPFIIAPGVVTADSNADAQTTSRSIEGQYLHRLQKLSFQLGAGYSDEDGRSDVLTETTVAFPGFPSFPPMPTLTVLDLDNTHRNAYVYAHWLPSSKAQVTFGLAYDAYEDVDVEKNKWSPKLGLTWSIAPATVVRAAAFKTLKRPLRTSQTLEPTTVAGFNQFFDDLNGSTTRRIGLGIDHRFSTNLHGGLEVSRRKISNETAIGGSVLKESQDEALHRAYVYWTPNPRWSLGLAYQYDDYETDSPNSGEPRLLTTHSLPFQLRHFPSRRIDMGLTLTGVRQSATLNTQTGTAIFTDIRSDDDFAILDVDIQYHLTRQRGRISVAVKNLLDQDLNYHDRNFQSQEFSESPLSPGRQVFVELALFH